MIALRITAVVMTVLVCPAFVHAEKVTPEDLFSGKFFTAAIRPLGDATDATLYSLADSYPPRAGESFHGRPVLGKVELKGDEARKATGAFQDATANSIADGMALCFEPHHGLRI